MCVYIYILCWGFFLERSVNGYVEFVSTGSWVDLRGEGLEFSPVRWLLQENIEGQVALSSCLLFSSSSPTHTDTCPFFLLHIPHTSVSFSSSFDVYFLLVSVWVNLFNVITSPLFVFSLQPDNNCCKSSQVFTLSMIRHLFSLSLSLPLIFPSPLLPLSPKIGVVVVL